MAKSADTPTAKADQEPPYKWATDATQVSVRAVSGGHWHGGRRYTTTPTLIAKADLTASQATRLVGDKRLVVTEVAAPATAGADPAP
jgi:hypothetical protein